MSKNSQIAPHLQQVIDEVCHEGCETVTRYIQDIQAGQVPDALRSLTDIERDIVLGELVEIMAVYRK